MSRYKIGDKVRIHSLEYIISISYSKGWNYDSLDLPGSCSFEKDMSQFCGKIVTIDREFPSEHAYAIKEDKHGFGFTHYMIEALVHEFTLGDIYE